MQDLKILSSWLKTNGFVKISQAIDDLSEPAEYDEPWHEEAVKEFDVKPKDEEDYFKEEVYLEPNDRELHKQIMKKEGFTPIAIGSHETSYIAGGAFGAVYEGIYNGIPAVIKVIEKYEYLRDNEVDNWKQILKAKEQLPSDMQKHIPEIYKLNAGSIYNDRVEEEVPYEVVIMEKLRKLPEDIIRVLLRDYKAEKSVDNILKDEDYLYTLAKTIKNLLGNIVLFKELIDKVTEEDILKLLLRVKNFDKSSSDKVSYSISEFIVNLDEEKSYEIFLKHGLESRFSSPEQFIFQKIKRYISNYIYPSRMMVNKENYYSESEYSPFWESIPETGSFYKTLIELYKNFNISWQDVHHNNIMIGKDGNLKIIDVGLYKDENENYTDGMITKTLD